MKKLFWVSVSVDTATGSVRTVNVNVYYISLKTSDPICPCCQDDLKEFDDLPWVDIWTLGGKWTTPSTPLPKWILCYDSSICEDCKIRIKHKFEMLKKKISKLLSERQCENNKYDGNIVFDLSNIMVKLNKLVRWRGVALHLRVPNHVADRIEQDHKGDTERQKMEAISWWLDNAEAASWWGLSVGLRKANYNTLARTVEKLAFEADASVGPQEDKGPDTPKKAWFYKIWKIPKWFTSDKVKKAIENIIQAPFNLFFKRRYKTRKQCERRQPRWWIEVKGDQEALKMLSSYQEQIEQLLSCHLEAKAC